MALRIATFAAALMAAAVAHGSAQAQDQSVEDFYKGKNVELYIGYSVGGGYDTYARLIAQHMGEHIPGEPTVVPLNMPGAGSLKLANWLAEAAPRDGTVFGTVARAAPFDPLFGNEAAQFDPRELNYIGSANNEVSVCVAYRGSGVESFEDLKTTEMIIGGTGPTSDLVQFPTVINAVLGTKMRIIDGYPGGNDVNLAMERGELTGRCGWSWSSVKSTRSDWVENGDIKILMQMSTAKHPDLPDTPLVTDLAADEDQRLLRLLFARQALGRPYVAPPGIPEERVKALQDAFMATMRDPDFLEEAERLDLEINPVPGPEVREIVLEAYDTPQETLDRLTAILSE